MPVAWRKPEERQALARRRRLDFGRVGALDPRSKGAHVCALRPTGRRQVARRGDHFHVVRVRIWGRPSAILGLFLTMRKAPEPGGGSACALARSFSAIPDPGAGLPRPSLGLQRTEPVKIDSDRIALNQQLVAAVAQAVEPQEALGGRTGRPPRPGSPRSRCTSDAPDSGGPPRRAAARSGCRSSKPRSASGSSCPDRRRARSSSCRAAPGDGACRRGRRTGRSTSAGAAPEGRGPPARTRGTAAPRHLPRTLIAAALPARPGK